MVCERVLRASLGLLVAVLLVSPALAITAPTPRTSADASASTGDGTQDDGGAVDGDGAGQEPASCDDRLAAAHEEVRAWYQDATDAWARFLERQAEEARSLRERGAPDDAWREASERWSAEADALHAETVAAFWQKARDRLDDCAERLGEPRREWDAAWSGWDGEPAEARGEDPAPEPYAPPEEPAEPHPLAHDAAWQELAAEAERVQAACRERVEALRAEAEAAGAGGAGGAEGDAWRERVHAAERDCAQRVRLLYDGYYEEEHREFGDSLGSLRMAWSDEERRVVVTGRHLELRGDPETATMEDLACRGPRYVDRLAADGFLAEFRPEETDSGTALRVFDDHGGLVFDLHDNGRCTLNLASTGAVPWMTLDLADRLDCRRSGDDVDCRDGDRRVVVLVHDGAADLGAGNDVTVRGRATFLVSRAPTDDAHPGSGASYAAAYEEAVLDKRVGAEVRIGRSSDGLAVDAAPIGDLEVRVEGGLSGIDVFVESAAGDGKTLSLAVEEALLRGVLPSVEAFAVADDGSERPIAVREASGLDDVLDPLDDGEAVEYWFSQEDGASVVLVSIPHFSQKRIHVAPDLLGSVGIDAPGPGLALLAPALLVAAVAAARRRA